MPWHSEPAQDLEARRQMINLIANYLEKRHPRTAEASDALVATARKLEVALYKACKTKQEYMETRSLAVRIRELERTGNFSLEMPPPATNNSTTTAPPAETIQAPPAAQTIPTPAPTTHAEVLKQRRNRLLLLKHASKCHEEEGKCSQPWCTSMKKLWKHVASCKAPECTYPHCVSSHYVLTHYHRCRDPECQVCGPVRDPMMKKRLSMETEKANQAANASKAPDTQENSSAIVNTKTPGVTASNRIMKEFVRGSREGSKPGLAMSMSRQAVQHHLDSLKVEQLQQAFFPLLRKLMENSKFNGGIFNSPVDDKDAPGYFKVISKPMDLGTVRRKLDDGKYRKVEEFESDVSLVFNNATTFNPRQHRVHSYAVELRNIFDADMKKIKQKLAEYSTVPKKGGICPLCNEDQCTKCILCDRGCIAYEPKILFCAGGCEANASRIQKNAIFYSLPGTSLNWCSDCHDRRKNENHVTDVSTGNVYNKLDLIKRKHDELFGEPWVCCDTCNKWCHQTCALFNSRKQLPPMKGRAEDPFICPKCLVRTEYTPAVKVPGAEDLEHTRLSKFLEMWVREKLGAALQQEKQSPTTRIRGEDPPPANAVTIRVLSNFDETFPVKAYAKTMCGFPEKFTYRSRAIFLFQHLDGVDVLLFVMYVQEYGSDAPPPNRGKVYIAYLDSVHFFRPRHHRTLVYHELLLAYLEYARRQGFTSCYIWACPPPTKKDDYILHCHPEDQRVPSHERLRMWYHEMIKRGVSEHIILSSCALFEEHYDATFKKNTGATKKKDTKKSESKNKKALPAATQRETGDAGKVLPSITMELDAPPASTSAGPGLFEDGYDLMEDINLDELNNGAPTPAPPPPTTPASEVGGTATPARRMTSSPPADDGPLFLGLRKSDLDEMDPEDLERRRAHKMAVKFQMPVFDGDYWPNEMEDVAIDFAKRSRETKAIGPSGKVADKKSGLRKNSETVTVDTLIASGEIKDVDPKAVLNRIGESLEAMKADFLVVKLAHECSSCGQYLLRGRWECRHPECLRAAGFNRPSPFALCEECFGREIQRPVHRQHGQEAQLGRPSPATSSSSSPPNQSGEGESETVVVKKEHDDDETTNGSEGEDRAQRQDKESWEKQPLKCTRLLHEQPSTASHQLYFVDEHIPLVTPRTDRTFRNHLLDTRHAFLSLCTGNRYAFNQLRRAKHSTMMILYHLHNPDAPAHLHTCNNCGEDIIGDYRYNCAICQGGDYDLCQRCATSVHHPHKLSKVEVTRTVDQEVSESKRKKGMEKRRQRKRSLQVFLNALVHASSCSAEGDCNEVACAKMKELLSHRTSCKVRVRGGCEICRRVLCLVQMHAKGTEQMPPCNKDKCPVPHCDDLKRHLRLKDAEGGATPRPGSAQLGAQPKGPKAKAGAGAGQAAVTGNQKKKLKAGEVASDSGSAVAATNSNKNQKKKKATEAPVTAAAVAPQTSNGELKVKLVLKRNVSNPSVAGSPVPSTATEQPAQNTADEANGKVAAEPPPKRARSANSPGRS